jgi:DnaJ family protein A protein 2
VVCSLDSIDSLVWSVYLVGQRGPKKGQDIEHSIPVSLADLYKGKKKKMKINRKIICEKCHGSGSKKGGKLRWSPISLSSVSFILFS